MQQLQFVELDESGRLVLSGDDGAQYAVSVDDRLRAALRPRPIASSSSGGSTVSPRDVQAMIRAGQPAEDVAASTGWELERVRRFEGPVLAEREHVVGLAQRAPVRAQGRTDGSHTLDRRVRERLQSRGVDLTAVSWDAARGEVHGPWTVIVAFAAGGRERRGAWTYDVQTRSVEALDDEARWLSEDEQALPGGLAGHPLLGSGHGEDEAAAELMATMRERRQRRGRRSQPSTRRTDDPTHVPGQQQMPDEVLPLEDLAYDPETMGDPPAAHPRGSAPEAAVPVGPEDDEADAEVEARDTAPTPEPVSTQPEPEPMSPEEAQRAVGRAGRAGRRRRGLRLPPITEPAPEHGDDEPEVTYARTRHDPREVTFDEFFGTDEDDDLPEQDEDRLDVEFASDDEQAEAEVDDRADAEVITLSRTSERAALGSDPDAVEASEADGESGEQVDDAESGDEVDDAEPDDEVDDAEPDDEVDGAESDDQVEESESTDDETPQDEPDTRPAANDASEDEPPSPPRKGRTSVPSWDDIMFGSRDRRG